MGINYNTSVVVHCDGYWDAQGPQKFEAFHFLPFYEVVQTSFALIFVFALTDTTI